MLDPPIERIIVGATADNLVTARQLGRLFVATITDLETGILVRCAHRCLFGLAG